ncbi:PP2C family protein-serine/threonine phosphatase [Candidatus Magnetaquicoccus inordinatus]|uniref:PP2C family protein-serine/threonine phosphatase n=1 Tax=Candidatus Magnetaquicoccus inordinatus TaxID=2496818 RepID=UPI00102B3FE8|nr:protein phosphatase 2C domain-containing protein [Candidatus Magnetaquicoccus inordinatus]
MAEKIGEHLLAVGRSNVGCVRPLNEDSFHIDGATGLLILADGMGGHDAGEVASAHVVQEVTERIRQFMNASSDHHSEEGMLAGIAQDSELDPEEQATLDDLPNPVLLVVREALTVVNAELNQLNQERGHPEDSGMGSTVVGLWAPPFSAYPVVFHVGDSRLYLFHGGQLQQKTRDHSLYQQWLSFGGKGMPPPQNILLQAIGPSRIVTPDVQFLPVYAGDTVLICSDGLTGMVTDAAIAGVLAELTADNLDSVCDRLITMAREGGGRDNVTVILGHFI